MSSPPRGARRPAIAVIGAGDCDAEIAAAAREIGRMIAERGAILVTGGGTGVMAAASEGAHSAGGLVVGILPGLDPRGANSAVDVVIPTGMGQLRNGLVVSSADAVIAVAGEWGTLSEIGFARKIGKPVIGWRSWELARDGTPADAPLPAQTPSDAVDRAFAEVGDAG